MGIQPLVDPELQRQFVLHNPFSFLSAMIGTLNANGFYIKNTVGIFGWFNYVYNDIVYFAYLLVFGYTIREIISYKKKIFPPLVTLSIFLICSLTFILLFIAMYMLWTPVSYTQIMGIQGRYFLPLFPFVFIIIHQLLISLDERETKKVLMWVFVIFITLETIITVLSRYYIEAKSSQNEVENLINSTFDTTKLKYILIDKPTSFNININDKNPQISGFKFYFTTYNQKINVAYRFRLMDKSCTKTYKEGDLDLKKLQGDSIYEEDFSPYLVTEHNICLILEPVSLSPKNHYISLVTNDKLPIIELLGKTE